MRRPVVLLSAALLLALFLCVPFAYGDTIYLKSGAKFEGKLIRETSTHYVFKIRGMGEQKFKKSEVKKVEKSEGAFDIYEKRKKTIAKDDAKGWYDLGMWCKEKGLRKESKVCFRAAMKADDDHSGARQELGYVKYHGDWITEKKYKKVAAEILKKEAEIIAGLKPADKPVQDGSIRYMIFAPAGWTAEKVEGEGVTFTGPELGFAPVTVELRVVNEASSLDELVKDLLKELKEETDGLTQRGEPADTTLAGQAAKMVVTAWTSEDLQPWAVDMERHDILMVAPHGANYQLSFTCASGYWEKLKTAFDKMIGSLKLLSKPLDVMAEEHGFGFAFPDDSYEKNEGLPINLQINNPNGGSHTLKALGTIVSAKLKEGPTGFVVKVDKKTEATTLESLRADLPKMLSIPQLIQVKAESNSRKVDGVDALWGEFAMAGGGLGRGYWCVFTKGERTYQCIFVTMINQMGRQYMKTDWDKFIDGFKFL